MINFNSELCRRLIAAEKISRPIRDRRFEEVQAGLREPALIPDPDRPYMSMLNPRRGQLTELGRQLLAEIQAKDDAKV